MILKVIIGALIVFIISVMLFINLAPQLGGMPTGDSLDRIKEAKNFKDGKFKNIEEMSKEAEFKLDTMVSFFKAKETKPTEPIKVQKLNNELDESEGLKVVWFGHSTLLLQLDDKKILLDPMLSKVPSPVPFIGGKRFSEELPIDIDNFPKLDAIVISHDHYDHLDYETVKKLKDRTEKFYAPLGVAAHLKRWGVEDSKIVELNWWESSKFDNISFTATPSQHFSGRGLTNRNSTLWCSWVIKSDKYNLFFSGDSGYHKEFKEIGEKYGPFDLTLMECGQYNEAWSQIHMMPEETVQAHIDVKGKILMPIHWGAFKLSIHPWYEPIERAMKAADKERIAVISPKIGEVLDMTDPKNIEWWKE